MTVENDPNVRTGATRENCPSSGESRYRFDEMELEIPESDIMSLSLSIVEDTPPTST
jgi:hypothetical protein